MHASDMALARPPSEMKSGTEAACEKPRQV